jgi:hypothetical protein
MTDADVAAAIGEHVRAFNDRDIDALMSGFTDDACWITGSAAACQLIDRLQAHGKERACFIAGFYRFRDGRIASAKIYREGSAEVGDLE